MPRDLAERFWSNVDRTAGSEGCWEWMGYKRRSKWNYGMFRLGTWLRDPQVPAHCVAYELTSGQVPPGLFVCHHCDNPPCCNPSHLYVGPAAENSKDMVTKGRQARGEARPDAKLTDADVIKIRRRAAEGETQRSLAAAFSVGQATISRVVTRERWRHVP